MLARMIPFLVMGALFFSFDSRASQICNDVQVGWTQGSNAIAPAPIYQQECRWVAGAVAFDVATRSYSAVWNYEGADQALSRAVSDCGKHCIAQSFYTDFIYVAMADDDEAYGISTKSEAEAINQCTTAGGVGCEVVIGGSSTAKAVYWGFSALAYDAATGASGMSLGQKRRREAMAEAMQRCGASGCWGFAFQRGYGAIARSKGGRLFSGWSGQDGLLFNAGRKASKACKDATGEKDCQVVASADSKGIAAEVGAKTQQLEGQFEQTMKEIETQNQALDAKRKQVFDESNKTIEEIEKRLQSESVSPP